MGNAQARKRIKASDFDYLAKNTNFLTLEVGKMIGNKSREIPIIGNGNPLPFDINQNYFMSITNPWRIKTFWSTTVQSSPVCV